MKSIDFTAATILVGEGIPEDSPRRPFDEESCTFLNALSKELLHHPDLKAFPDVSTFAFWCRRANIARLQERFSKANQNITRIGRGMSLHIAPSNVPVNFAYSFVFAFLSGNSCVVRIPSKPFRQIGIICDSLNSVLEKYPRIARRLLFVSYPSDSILTPGLSAIADARLVWGGDATVANLRAMPCSARCIDVFFGDRYSVALFDGDAMYQASDAELRRLAEAFYNDTYLMDQNACSSPQCIYWINPSDSGKKKFWEAVSLFVQNSYELQASVSIDKYIQECEDILDKKIVGFTNESDSYLVRAELDPSWTQVSSCKGVGGYFYEKDIAVLSEISSDATERFQTLVYYGVDPDDIVETLVAESARGIDRVVPLGTALDIDIVWDGYDLVGTLSRIIDER